MEFVRLLCLVAKLLAPIICKQISFKVHILTEDSSSRSGMLKCSRIATIALDMLSSKNYVLCVASEIRQYKQTPFLSKAEVVQ